MPAFAGSSVRDRGKNGEGDNGGYRLHWRVQGSTSIPTVVGSRRGAGGGGGFMEFGLSQTEISAHFSEGNLAQFGRSTKLNSGAT